MIRRTLVLGLYFSLILQTLAFAAAQQEQQQRQEVVKSEDSSSQMSGAHGKVLSEIQEEAQTRLLPQKDGAWLIEMSRSGGMRAGKESVFINSDGEISVIAERYESGRTVIDCSYKGKLSAEDFQKLKTAMTSAKLSKWREGYDNPKHPICCDQPTTSLTVHRREIAEGDGGGDGTVSQTTSWYPGSSQLRPKDLVNLATIAQTLWNNTRERCQ